MTDARTQKGLDTAEKKLRNKNHTRTCSRASTSSANVVALVCLRVAFVPIGDSSSYTASHSQPDLFVDRFLDFCTSSSAFGVLFAVAVKILSWLFVVSVNVELPSGTFSVGTC